MYGSEGVWEAFLQTAVDSVRSHASTPLTFSEQRRLIRRHLPPSPFLPSSSSSSPSYELARIGCQIVASSGHEVGVLLHRCGRFLAVYGWVALRAMCCWVVCTLRESLLLPFRFASDLSLSLLRGIFLLSYSLSGRFSWTAFEFNCRLSAGGGQPSPPLRDTFPAAHSTSHLLARNQLLCIRDQPEEESPSPSSSSSSPTTHAMEADTSMISASTSPPPPPPPPPSSSTPRSISPPPTVRSKEASQDSPPQRPTSTTDLLSELRAQLQRRRSRISEDTTDDTSSMSSSHGAKYRRGPRGGDKEESCGSEKGSPVTMQRMMEGIMTRVEAADTTHWQTSKNCMQ